MGNVRSQEGMGGRSKPQRKPELIGSDIADQLRDDGQGKWRGPFTLASWSELHAIHPATILLDRPKLPGVATSPRPVSRTASAPIPIPGAGRRAEEEDNGFVVGSPPNVGPLASYPGNNNNNNGAVEVEEKAEGVAETVATTHQNGLDGLAPIVSTRVLWPGLQSQIENGATAIRRSLEDSSIDVPETLLEVDMPFVDSSGRIQLGNLRFKRVRRNSTI